MKKENEKSVKRNPLVFTLIYGMIVIIAAQLRLPMFTDGFVISAGVILFALFMLLLDEFATLQVMCISAVGIMITRAFAEAGFFISPDVIWDTGMPEFAFYLVYGILIYLLFNYCKAQGHYMIIFAALAVPDLAANLVEIYIRMGDYAVDGSVIVSLLAVAVIRSGIIMAIYAFIMHYGLPVLKMPELRTENNETADTVKSNEDSLMMSVAADAEALYDKLRQADASPEIMDKMKILMDDVGKAAVKQPDRK